MFGKKTIVHSFYWKDMKFPKKYEKNKKLKTIALEILDRVEKDRQNYKTVTEYDLPEHFYNFDELRQCLIEFELLIIEKSDSELTAWHQSCLIVDICSRRYDNWYDFCSTHQSEVIDKISDVICSYTGSFRQTCNVVVNVPDYMIDIIIQKSISKVGYLLSDYIVYSKHAGGYVIQVANEYYNRARRRQFDEENKIKLIGERKDYKELIRKVSNKLIDCFEKDCNQYAKHRETKVSCERNGLSFCFADENMISLLLLRKGYIAKFEVPTDYKSGEGINDNKDCKYNWYNKTIKITRSKEDKVKKADEIIKMKETAEKYGFGIDKIDSKRLGIDMNLYNLDLDKDFVTELEIKLQEAGEIME